MKKLLIPTIIAIIIVLLLIYILIFRSKNDTKEDSNNQETNQESPASDIFNISNEESQMNISSPAFAHNSTIPVKYTCDGDGINPPLEISAIPDKTKSLVLIVDDPDAPVGLWTHWLVWNIQPKTASIEEGSIPPNSVEGTTSFGRTGWGSPCPPDKEHRYFFKIFALDSKIDLSPSSRVDDLEAAMEGHILDQAELVGLYDRPR